MRNTNKMDKPVSRWTCAQAARDMRDRAAKADNYSDAAYLDKAADLLARVALGGVTGPKRPAIGILRPQEPHP